MAELKTKETRASVAKFISGISDEQRRKDCKALLKLMERVSKSGGKMWGSSIVGFGNYHYKYASGREGDWFVIGFSPRKQALSIYAMCDLSKSGDLLKKIGKHKHGRGCLYVKTLEDIDLAVLEKILKRAIAQAREVEKGLKK